MTNIVWRTCVVVAIGAALCWCAVQKHRMQYLNAREDIARDHLELHDELFNRSFEDIGVLIEANNGNVQVIEAVCDEIGIEVRKDNGQGE